MTKKFLKALNFPGIVAKQSGKVREGYFTHDGLALFVATNRVSAFDRVFNEDIPHKGAVLNLIAAHFLKDAKTRAIIKNWLMYVPHPNVSAGIKCEPFMFEVIVREYITGSMWKDYEKGQREFWGITLPDGMKKSQKLPEIMVTPSTKALKGHDMPILGKEIVHHGLSTSHEWEKIHDTALRLFTRGSEMAAEKGLILVDTKYEFGKLGDEIYLTDEVHTPDSSRYYEAEGYEERQSRGEKHEELSKEYLRDELTKIGFKGDEGQETPELSETIIRTVSDKYVALYERLTGKKFPHEAEVLATIAVAGRNALAKIRFEFANAVATAKPIVGIIMGSKSDLDVMDGAALALEEFCIPYDVRIISAHRAPHDTAEYATIASSRGFKVIIAGAGGSAALPGVLAAHTELPVIGVPIKMASNAIENDSVLSILQMPPDVPVLCVGLNSARNAGVGAAEIFALFDENVAKLVVKHKVRSREKVGAMADDVAAKYGFTEF